MNNLPAPKTRVGWMFSLFLMIITFGFYYFAGFGFLLEKYTDSFWFTETYTNPLAVEAKVPSYLSLFVARELTIRIDNRTTDTKDVNLVVSAVKYQEGDSHTPVELKSAMKCTGEAELAPVLICEKVDERFAGCGDGSNVIDFGTIPVDGQVVKTLWVIVQPEKLEGDQKNTTQSRFIFKQQINGEDSCLPLNKSAIAKMNVPPATLAQSFLRTLLLPPWSNGLIPVLVLFVVYTSEGKIQPKKKSNDSHWRAFGFVSLLYVGIVSIIVSFPLIISHLSSDSKGDSWIYFSSLILGLLSICFSKKGLRKIEPTDLKDNDPMYQVEDVPVKPVKIDESVKNTLKRIETDLNNNLSSSSQTLKKIEADLSKLSVSSLALVLTEQKNSSSSSVPSRLQESIPELKVFSDRKNINTFLNWIKDFDISEVTKSLVLLEKFGNDKQIQDKIERILRNVINKTVPSEFRRWLRDFSKPDKPIENFYVLNTLINLSVREPDLLAGSSLQLKEGEELQETPESVISNLLEPAALQHKDQKNIIKGLIKDFTKENEEAFKVFLQSLLDLYWTERCSANDILDFMSGRSYKDTNDFGVIFDSIKTHTADTVRFADLLKELQDNVEELALSEDLQNYFLGKLNSIK